MRAKSNAGPDCFGRASSSPPRRRGLIMVGGSAIGGVGGCLRPLSVLDLANNRVLPNSPHASSGGGWAGRPCSETGSTQGRVGFAPPVTSVASSGGGRHLPRGAGGDRGVPRHSTSDHDEQLAQQRGGDRGAGLAVAQRVVGAGGQVDEASGVDRVVAQC